MCDFIYRVTSFLSEIVWIGQFLIVLYCSIVAKVASGSESGYAFRVGRVALGVIVMFIHAMYFEIHMNLYIILIKVVLRINNSDYLSNNLLVNGVHKTKAD